MRQRIQRMLTAAVGLLLLLSASGCGFSFSPTDLYSLPQLPEEYTELNSSLNQLLESGAEYAAPVSGSNIQPVQLEDLDGDGEEEALAFFRNSADEKPLKIYIFTAGKQGYEQAAVIEGTGTSIYSIAYEDLDQDGRKELLVGWRVNTDLLALSVYTLRSGEPEELVQGTSYVKYAVNDLNMEIGHKETLGFVGETGAGKTTTAMTIMGLLPTPPGKVTSGEILFDGRDMLTISDKERRSILGEEISMIFQDPMTSLNPSMRVGDQIVEMIRLHKKIGKKEAMVEAENLLEMVGIRRERARSYPHQFSGGMKQRVVIAIALACRPKLIIADEPTTALDVTIQAQVMNLIKGLKEKFGTSMILITHDLGIVAEICDKVAIMYAGQIVEYASVEKVYNNPSHPYTNGLFNSIPKLDTEEEWLEEIHGLPPEPTEQIEGCAFSPRCPNCMEICKHKKPGITHIDEEHYVRCFLYEKEEGEADD